MRRIRDLLGLLLLAAAAVAGCETTDNYVRPPKPPEEFNAPPANDPRYSGPVEYPREVMEQDMLQKKAKDNSKAPNPLNSPRAGGAGGMRGGMGGY
ncbi:MAG: hypothetical protein U0797_18850 [Gemmataceae bacterium]